MKVKELLKTKSKWTKDVWARTKKGETIHRDDNDAYCFCLGAAIARCYRDVNEVIKVEQKVMAEIKRRFPRRKIASIPAFNDRKDTTFTIVKSIVNKLDI